MKQVTDELGIHHIRTTAHNPRANGMIERAHRTLKAALKARGGLWLDELPIILLGMRTRPDEDGSSAFSRVTGEQPLVPPIATSNIDMTELAIHLQKLPLNYKPTRTRRIDSHQPEKLNSCSHIWLRIDRVRRPLEAPYQGPFEVLTRTNDTLTISVRGKPMVVSVDRVKPAVLPPAAPVEPPTLSSAPDALPNAPTLSSAPDALPSAPTCAPVDGSKDVPADARQVQTRSGRQVSFKKNPQYCYY